MGATHNSQTMHCADCGAVLSAGAKCASCLRPPALDAAQLAERARRYDALPPRVANGGIIMPQ